MSDQAPRTTAAPGIRLALAQVTGIHAKRMEKRPHTMAWDRCMVEEFEAGAMLAVAVDAELPGLLARLAAAEAVVAAVRTYFDNEIDSAWGEGCWMEHVEALSTALDAYDAARQTAGEG